MNQIQKFRHFQTSRCMVPPYIAIIYWNWNGTWPLLYNVIPMLVNCLSATGSQSTVPWSTRIFPVPISIAAFMSSQDITTVQISANRPFERTSQSIPLPCHRSLRDICSWNAVSFRLLKFLATLSDTGPYFSRLCNFLLPVRYSVESHRVSGCRLLPAFFRSE